MEPVELEFRVKDDDLEQGSKRVVNAILGIDSASKQTITTLRSQIAEQKSAIRQIEADMDMIGKKIAAAPQGRTKDGLLSEFRAAQRVLEEEKSVLKGLEEQLNVTAEATRRLSTEKRELNDRMARLKLAGQQNSEEFKRMADEAGNLERATREVNRQTSLIGKADANFQGLISGVSGVSGAFSAGAGAMALFGQKSQDLQQVQTRLQALMALTIGLQQTYNTLYKESAFQTIFVANAKKAWTAAQTMLNVQLGLSVGLSKALMVSGIGILIAGIAGLVVAYRNWNKELKDSNKVQQEVRQNTQDEITRINALESVLKNSNNAYQTRNEALTKLREIMPTYNAQLDKEGQLIADNTQALVKYVKQLKATETAKIYTSRLAKAQVEYNDFLDSLDNGTRKIVENRVNGVYNDGLSGSESMRIFEEKAFKYMQEIKRLEEKVQNATAESLGDNNAPIINNYDALSKKLNELTKDFRNLDKSMEGTDTWNNLKKEISDTRKELDRYSLEEEKKNKPKSVNEDNKIAREFAQAQQRQRQIEDIERRIQESKVNFQQETDDELLSLKEEGLEKELALIARSYDKKMNEISRYGEEMIRQQQEIEQKMWEEQNPDWDKKRLTFAPTTTKVSQLPDGIYKKILDRGAIAEDQMNKNVRDALQKRLADYQSYENKQREIQKKYTDLRLALDTQYAGKKSESYYEALKNIEQAERDENEVLLQNNLEATEAFRNLNRVIEQEGRAAIQERIRRLEEYLKEVAKAAGEESELYKRAYQEVKQARKELDNDTIESYRHFADIMKMVSDNMSGSGSGLSKAAAEIAQSAIQVYQAFKSNGSTGEKVSSIVGLIANVTASLRDWSYEGLKIEDTLGEQEKLYRAIADQIDVANARLIRQKLLLDDMTGSDLISGKYALIDANVQRQKDALERLKALNVDYIESQREIFKDNIFGSHVENKGFGGFLVKFFTGGQAQTFTETVLKEIDTNLLKTVDDYRELLWLIQSNGGMYSGKQVVESDLEALKLLIDEYDNAVVEQKAIMKELESAFTNTTADAISQSIADGFMSGKRSMEDFADDFETLMKNAVRASFRINVSDMMAKDFFQKFVDATQSDFILTAEEIAALKDDFRQRIEDAGNQWKMFEDILSQAGIELDNMTGKQQKQVGGFQTMSQETGGLLLGQFTAIRVHTGNIYDLINNLSLDRGTIATILTSISQNTYNTVRELVKVNERFRRIEAEGVKIV